MADEPSELPEFPLFRDPVGEKVFEHSGKRCDVCGNSRGWTYAGPTYGQGDELTVCPWCIADGSAGKRGICFNDAIIYPCLDSAPQLTPEDRDEVAHRTPGFTTWQDNGWRICCGRACVYVGEATAERLRGPLASLRSFLKTDIDLGWSDEEKEEWLNTFGWGGSPAVYAFECQVCGKLQCYWDFA